MATEEDEAAAEAGGGESRTHDAEKHDDVFNAVLAKAVQESIITFQQSLKNELKKKMRIKLVALYAAAHACGGVDWNQLDDLANQCKINDDCTLAGNLEVVAGIIGARQKRDREKLAEANLANAKSAAQREKFQAELDLQQKSLPRATLCPALKALIRQQEEGALDRLTDAERGGERHIEPHAGASLLKEMIVDIRKKGHVMLHEPTLAEWRAMGLYQYYELAEVWPQEFRLLNPIDKQRIRDWISGLKPGAAIDGPMWWAAYARKCGYVERDADGNSLRDDEGNTTPLVFDDRFEVDHLIMSASMHESKNYLLSPILDHPENYMIVYKGPNQHLLFKQAFGKLCILKAYLLGAVGAQHVTNAHQHRQCQLEKNRQAVQKEANKVLGAAVANRHLKPYSTASKLNQEKNMKRLIATTRKRDAINAMFANAAKRARTDEGAGTSSAAADESDTLSTEDAGASGGQQTLGFAASASSTDAGVMGEASASAASEEEPDGTHTPPGSPPPSGQSAKAAGKKRAKPPADKPAAKKTKKEADADAPAVDGAKVPGNAKRAKRDDALAKKTCSFCGDSFSASGARSTTLCRMHDGSARCNNWCFNYKETLRCSKRENLRTGGKILWFRKNVQGEQQKNPGFCTTCRRHNEDPTSKAAFDQERKASNMKSKNDLEAKFAEWKEQQKEMADSTEE